LFLIGKQTKPLICFYLRKKKRDPISYAMMSNYQVSFLIRFDGPTIYVSHWFPREKLLLLTYLLFLLRYDDYVPADLKEFVKQIHDSFLKPQSSEASSKLKARSDRRGGGDGGNNNHDNSSHDDDDSHDDDVGGISKRLRSADIKANMGNGANARNNGLISFYETLKTV